MRYPLKLMVLEHLNQQQKEELRTWIYIAFSGNKISFIFLVSLLSHVKHWHSSLLEFNFRKHGLKLQFNNFAMLLKVDLANRVKRHWV